MHFFPLWRCWDSDTQQCSLYFFVFRLNIPPFVPARTVLEDLESVDFCENGKPVKTELTDTKVKTRTGRPQRCSFFHHQVLSPPALIACCNCAFILYQHRISDRAKHKGVKGEEGDLLRLCHTVPQEVVNLGGLGIHLFMSEIQHFLCFHFKQMPPTSLCFYTQVERATIQRKQTTLTLRHGCSVTMWMEWNLFGITMAEQCGSQWVPESHILITIQNGVYFCMNMN